MKKPNKPKALRLTLNSDEAAMAFAQLMANQRPPRLVGGYSRPDGKYDVPISYSLMDQLQTHAIARENLSDTVLRVMSKEAKQ